MPRACPNAHTVSEKRACQALRYRVHGNDWRVVARMAGYADAETAKAHALAHLEKEAGEDVSLHRLAREAFAA